MKVSVLITAHDEAATIGKAIECIADSSYSGIPDDFEIILACPDDQTRDAATKKVEELQIQSKFIHITDPGKKEGKGKPTALNMVVEKATGEILIFTDGDVYFGKHAVKELVETLEKEAADLATGRPVSSDSKNNRMGYFGHLLADAAHHKRTVELTENPQGKSITIVSKNNFFPVSGYIYALKRSFLEKLPKHNVDYGLGVFPENTLVDDAYISYVVFNNGGKTAYAPHAYAYIKYATNLKDYYAQKKRSTGGYVQLWEYGVVKKETKTRSFKKELEYFWFPFSYAKNLQELWWSLQLFPIRLWLWVMIFWERRVIKKDFIKTWSRIESTK